ncbi:hypothetical protein MTR67_037645 [Solanum verrucosum]|uniref:Uncharacterized protein n=1 Tax=Solanum verrucosum TaxID=315347 RepID=A0AAF0UDU8_SOLVR|nr:hypothetical protein MTR67_037645 [Solanum verrucosum]
MDISLFEQPNFQREYLTHTNSESEKLGSVGNIIPRYFQPYLEIHLTHPELGVMSV